MVDEVEGAGTPGDPWQLKTPPGSSGFEAYLDPEADPPALVVQVGKTQLRSGRDGCPAQSWRLPTARMPLGARSEHYCRQLSYCLLGQPGPLVGAVVGPIDRGFSSGLCSREIQYFPGPALSAQRCHGNLA